MAQMRRWFVALVPPRGIQEKASTIISELTNKYGTRTARAVPHVTLIAPFELPADDGDAIQPVVQAIQRVATTSIAFDVGLTGFKSFAPRVLYIDVNRTTELTRLQLDLTRELADKCGIAPDRRAYQPHMTVASRKMNKDKFAHMWKELENKEFNEEWRSTEVSLLMYEDLRWKVDRTFILNG